MFGVDLFVGPFLITILLGIPTLILLYRFGTRNHDYWKKRGVAYVKPLPFIGNILDNFRKPLQLVEEKRYKELGPIYGHFEGNKHLLNVADPTLLREIFVKDFQIFNRRRDFRTGDSVMDSNVSQLTGEDWKRVRSIVSPTFSTGKMKRMMSIFKDCSKTLIQNFRKRGESIDAKRLYGAFTMDVIASSAFSTKIDSHNDPNNEFLNNARKAFPPGFNWRFVILFLSYPLMKLFRISIFPPEAMDFFKTATKQIIEERKRTGQVRNDFLQLLIDTAKEVAEDEKEVTENEKEDIASNYEVSDAGQQMYKYVTKKHLSMDELVGQCVIFFLAGYETTAITLSCASYMLALNQDVQDKLRSEVDAAVKENNGKLTYEAIQSMKYLDNVISETLRLFPPAVRLERVADSDYTLGDTGITVEKDTLITIPVYSLHRDPELYPDPERFNPDRFTAEDKANRNPYTYLPFGHGPRNCVGMRFALLEIKVCLAEIIANFNIKKSPKTKVPVEYKVNHQQLISPKEIILNMEIRRDSPY